MPAPRVQNGTISAHGRTWPTWSRDAYWVVITGEIDAGLAESAESLKAELEKLVEPHGLRVRVSSAQVSEMAPEDLAEKNELDRQAMAASGYAL